MTACLMCAEDADALRADLIAARALNRRLALELARTRAKHRRFADETNHLLTKQAKETHS